LAHTSLSLEDTLKLNVDGNFLEDSFLVLRELMGVIRNYEGDWVTEFSHHEIGGDVLLAELRAIQMKFEFCRNKSYSNNNVCESNCLQLSC
jgi:hypothetical protein